MGNSVLISVVGIYLDKGHQLMLSAQSHSWNSSLLPVVPLTQSRNTTIGFWHLHVFLYKKVS
jgi:hypothetical protein